LRGRAPAPGPSPARAAVRAERPDMMRGDGVATRVGRRRECRSAVGALRERPARPTGRGARLVRPRSPRSLFPCVGASWAAAAAAQTRAPALSSLPLPRSPSRWAGEEGGGAALRRAREKEASSSMRFIRRTPRLTRPRPASRSLPLLLLSRAGPAARARPRPGRGPGTRRPT
jgi:hypothetical protein